MLFFGHLSGILWSQPLSDSGNVYGLHPRSTTTETFQGSTVGILWRRCSPKSMFSSRLHDMPALQMFFRQSFQNDTDLSCSKGSNTSWRASDFTLLSLDVAMREKDWLFCRGGWMIVIIEYLLKRQGYRYLSRNWSRSFFMEIINRSNYYQNWWYKFCTWRWNAY